MAQKTVVIDGIGQVVLAKRKGMKHLRLTIGTDGMPRISMPGWVPYSSGITFAMQRQDWIKQHAKHKVQHRHGQLFGKGLQLQLKAGDVETIKTRVIPTGALVFHPLDMASDNALIQQAAERVIARALKKQAEELLLPRLQDLSLIHDIPYSSASVRRLKSRWGSCSSARHITLSSYLVQLPWDLIEYVLLHELVHTKIMAHGKQFWTELAIYVDDLPVKRKLIRSHQARIMID